MQKKTGRTGRRPGKTRTPEAILRSAREAFASNGYDGTSIRQIATGAGVDPALVHHHFGTKEELFLKAIEAPIQPEAMMDDIFAADVEAVPERVVRTFLGVCEGPVSGPALLGLLRGAMAHQWQAALLRELFYTQIARRLVHRLGEAVDPEEVPFRASLVSSQLFGLAMSRYALRLQPLADAPRERVIAIVAPTIRRYVLEELGTGEDDAP
ncbi:TetR family transcriptional regulator [Streptomyces sp. AJS327]|uniref:TetR/AcrR family transcriptional regulator n=1 Tax=Streptomyces sp. AJS327 TaxID=2545265 RepID=UPI001C60FFF7|nr:TetR family transcriptional regulator [Streptomyces sp. AJS327]